MISLSPPAHRSWRSTEPFGQTTVTGQATANPLQYTGRENDGTGLSYYRARYYSPTRQRFISQDPLGFLGGDTNLYAYVLNDPISFTDPTGESILPAVVLCAVGGAVGYNMTGRGKGLLGGCAVGAALAAAPAAALSACAWAPRACMAAMQAAAAAAGVSGQRTSSKDFFAGTKYSPKVQGQMKEGNLHGFPENVRGFQDAGQRGTITGEDGVTREILRIPGRYMGKNGNYEFIKEPDGTINHRFFRPRPD